MVVSDRPSQQGRNHNRPHVEYRRRTSLNTWETVIYQTGDFVVLNSIDLQFAFMQCAQRAIAELYRGLDN